jgi:prolyl-tRNA editing enzyme YbaK/EbsC (Cys-tRNA(Pro) deacylase)
MSAAIDRFLAAAADQGIAVAVTRYPQGTRTAADAAAAIGCDVAEIVKSLVFVADDAPVLALTSGANRVDTAKLAALLGAAKVRQANADEVRAATGFAIGGTPPFGHVDGQLRSVVDIDLVGFAQIWAAAGTPDSVFPLTPDQLLAATGATPGEFGDT